MYICTLYMLLPPHTTGKRACMPDGSSALRSLGELLEHEDQEVGGSLAPLSGCGWVQGQHSLLCMQLVA